ncbi:cytochrome c oxidase assembly protein [Anaerobacillus sp. MEB173]|uniref:cytochrome c oxidase assembly protein n=1 Tax=Anaerobacillus sp. MEB173 TaxID=3383345 RepID=UPI003F90C425
MNNHTHSMAAGDVSLMELLLIFPLLFSLFFYLIAIVLANQNDRKKWPIFRTLSFVTGIICVLIVVTGPIAELAHKSFTMHMLCHLLLGMIAPLLIVIASPVTVVLRTLPVSFSRRMTRLLKSRVARFYTDPVVASILNIGGLWLLYTTPLFVKMHESMLLYALIHLHVFAVGYLFTLSMIPYEPVPHKARFAYRSVVLIIAIAGHGILSKYLYSHPPLGISTHDAENGAMLMYYGGDLIDAVIIFLFCCQWFKATRPKSLVHSISQSNITSN